MQAELPQSPPDYGCIFTVRSRIWSTSDVSACAWALCVRVRVRKCLCVLSLLETCGRGCASANWVVVSTFDLFNELGSRSGGKFSHSRLSSFPPVQRDIVCAFWAGWCNTTRPRAQTPKVKLEQNGWVIFARFNCTSSIKTEGSLNKGSRGKKKCWTTPTELPDKLLGLYSAVFEPNCPLFPKLVIGSYWFSHWVSLWAPGRPTQAVRPQPCCYWASRLDAHALTSIYHPPPPSPNCSPPLVNQHIMLGEIHLYYGVIRLFLNV